MTRFQVGDRVRIREQRTLFHSRVPLYARGQVGHVERVLPEFVIPEDEAWGRLEGRRNHLYRVALRQADVWPGYRGPGTDTVELEIFEHWLEPVSTP